MMMSDRIGLSGPDLGAILASLGGRLASLDAPSELNLDDQGAAPEADWPAQMMSCEYSAMGRWGDAEQRFVALDKGELIRLLDARPADPEAMLADLVAGQTPFELASFASLHPWRKAGYWSRSFGGLHYPHGWLCAFRGKGHDSVVSRRWLEFGPWRVLRGPGDVTLVQFHDPEADMATAVEQARVGHPLLSIATEGSGLLNEEYVPQHDLNGLYDSSTGTLRIIVHGRQVTPGEMTDACHARKTQPLGPDQPIRNIAYVFMEPPVARALLHDLWLRGLECWTIDLGREVRLDEDHHPTPVKPDWVKALEAR